MSRFIHCHRCRGRHWGAHGAAGLLLVSEGHVLLQQRSRHVDHPGTWSIPGGALQAGEAPRDGALREASEELAGLNPDTLTHLAEHVNEHGAWRYITAIASVPGRPTITAGNWEAARVEWVALGDVDRLHLHPGLAESWPELAHTLTTRGENMTTDDYRDELTGWRLYLLHRGRLCSPLAGDLSPVDRDAEAVCQHPQTGERLSDHAPPAAGCHCGWRIADNLPALVPAAESLSLPGSVLPTHARLTMEHGPRDTSLNAWGWPMDVLQTWDWPAPALVRVRGHGGVRRADEVHHMAGAIRRAVAANGQGHRMIEEGPGMWRARRVEIVGPILTGTSPARQFTADPRDVAEHYGATYHHATRSWESVMARAVAGRIAPRLLGEHEPPKPARTGQRAQPRGKKRAKKRAGAR